MIHIIIISSSKFSHERVSEIYAEIALKHFQSARIIFREGK